MRVDVRMRARQGRGTSRTQMIYGPVRLRGGALGSLNLEEESFDTSCELPVISFSIFRTADRGRTCRAVADAIV